MFKYDAYDIQRDLDRWEHKSWKSYSNDRFYAELRRDIALRNDVTDIFNEHSETTDVEYLVNNTRCGRK
jgi:hypothetical protein